METTEQDVRKRATTEYTIKLFAGKSELLAVSSFDLYSKDEEIYSIIGFIIIHQAVELILKASCIFHGISIAATGGKTITFEEALKRNSNHLSKDEKHILYILNNKRNAFQHDAIFDVSDTELSNSIFNDTLSIIQKMFTKINYNASELEILLEDKGE